MELRAATVVAVGMIFNKMQVLGSMKLNMAISYEYEIDWVLWQMGEKNLGQMKPHHRVRSIYY